MLMLELVLVLVLVLVLLLRCLLLLLQDLPHKMIVLYKYLDYYNLVIYLRYRKHKQ